MHLAVDQALLGQLVDLSAEQGWQLLTLNPTPQADWTATMADPDPGRGARR